MPIQNIKRIQPITGAAPDPVADGPAYGVHYDDSPDPLIVVVYVLEGDDNAHAREDHARGVAERHVTEHGLPDEKVTLVVDADGNESVATTG